jgi:WD40 repeat protein
VRLVDPLDGAIRATLAGTADQVLTLAWSADGKSLAAGGGMPGAFGEVYVWEVPTSGAAWAKPRILKEHSEVVLSLAWRPDGAQLATGSQDKTARVWDVTSGKTLRTLKDHVDVVTAVAYSPDGKWLATGGTDRSVKLYNAADLSRAATLPHAEGITALAFSGKSDLIATAAADKQVRVWPVKSGAIENPLRQHGEGEAVSSMAFSADGKSFVWGAINRKVQLWNGEVSGRIREMNDAQDWVYAVALSPDGKRIAAGAGDGKLYLWSAADGKLQRAVSMSGRP